jgi:hypothetical protein
MLGRARALRTLAPAPSASVADAADPTGRHLHSACQLTRNTCSVVALVRCSGGLAEPGHEIVEDLVLRLEVSLQLQAFVEDRLGVAVGLLGALVGRR